MITYLLTPRLGKCAYVTSPFFDTTIDIAFCQFCYGPNRRTNRGVVFITFTPAFFASTYVLWFMEALHVA